ncbi:MAG: DEAD/DEAH box helicase family protein [Firmicutes bacterium]|nr:DEAD/DEAH box helicase family protein [Bacillota bacterium]
MLRRRSVLYAVVLEDGSLRYGHSPRPVVDRAWWAARGARDLVALGPPLPPVWADWVCSRLQAEPAHPRWASVLFRAFQRRRGPGEAPDPDAGVAVRAAASRAQRLLGAHGYAWRASPDAARVGHFEPPEQEDLDAVASVVGGRLLTGPEIARRLAESQAPLSRPLEECLTWLALDGRLKRHPGVRRMGWDGFCCSRCGETAGLRPWDCAACGERECWRCEACRSMGPITGCLFVYAAPAAPVAVPRTATVTLRMPQLAPAQERAAAALDRLAAGPLGPDKPREALVWAVCGAGKTEATFPAIARVLGRGGRVLFAVPRRDVVQELALRIAEAFPAVELNVLFGGGGRNERPRLAAGSVTVATTHQVLRFYRAFDLAVLDEPDAFPYRGSPMLVRAVERAVRDEGLLVRMTATPDRELLRRAEAGQSLLVPIPARHHGHPLPEPELLVDRTLDGSRGSGQAGRPYRPSDLVLALLRRSLEEEPPARVLVFVPTVALSEAVGRGLKAALPAAGLDVPVGWSHSRDPDRSRVRDAFMAGSLKVLVATSILERGVTVPGVDVIVLYSHEERIFQTAALVQMAGRAGRTAERPHGRVAFVGGRITPSMRDAAGQIRRMNQMARELGLLRTSSEAPAAGGFGREVWN